MQANEPEPSDSELDEIELFAGELATDDNSSLEALWSEAQEKAPEPAPQKRKRPGIDPGLPRQVEEARLRAIYSNPDNWERVRGVALIDEQSGTLLGNFSEYRHKSVPNTWDWKREHQPIEVSGTKLVNGYLGEALEREVRGQTWTEEREVTVLVQLDELMLEAPDVKLTMRTRFGGIIQARLASDTQFASASGNEILLLPAGTDIWRATSTDTKVTIRKELP